MLPPRSLLLHLLQALAPSASPPPIVSVDAPSGWHIEGGPTSAAGGSEPLAPDMLVSLTAPKQCAQHFKVGCMWEQGQHALAPKRQLSCLDRPCAENSAPMLLLLLSQRGGAHTLPLTRTASC